MKIKWQAPVFAIVEPSTDSLMVVQLGPAKGNPSKIVRIRDDASAELSDTVLTINARLVYSLEFHPNYRTNGYLYVFSNGPTGQPQRINRISRFTVSRSSPYECDPNSERTIIEWPSSGHDGGGLVFGKDGLLYITTGDGTTGSDRALTGQDLSDLAGGVLRIDVDHPDNSRGYSVPGDNPFIGWKNARPELWAYGLRNPWRLCVDAISGQMWAGNNGEDAWESAHLIRRGENYGWSVYEGSHPCYLNRKFGPTPVVPPTVEHHHAEMRSLTGGVVYRGEQIPELDGVYIYGDFSTGQVWGARHDGSRVTWHKKLAETQLQITAFALDHHGGLLIVDYAGGVYRLVRKPPTAISTVATFPVRLSETGLFTSTREHRPEPGVIPYSVNAEAWADGAKVQRFMALPGESRIEYGSDTWTLPDGSVLVQTLSLEREAGNHTTGQRVETRLLTIQNGQWAGYSYRWAEDQSDATLVESKGGEKEFAIRDSNAPGGVRRQVWRYPSRVDCMACHSRAARFVLGMTEIQMNKAHDYGTRRDNQLRSFRHIGLFSNGPEEVEEAAMLPNPYDVSQKLDARVRAYLHVNCSSCHMGTGGGNANMRLGFKSEPEKTNIFDTPPEHDTFGIDNAMLIASGDPSRSILLQRLSRRGPGQMPPLVSTVVDEQAVALLRGWILGLKPQQQSVREWKMEDVLPALERIKEARSFDAGQKAFRQTGCVQCHHFAGEGGGLGPNLTGVGRRLSAHNLLESIVEPSKTITEGYAATVIETTSGDTLFGRIEREDDQMLVLRPLVGTDPTTVAKKNVRQRSLSNLSNMPTGIVNTLELSQILDLLTYLVSDGDAEHPAFQTEGKVLKP